MTLLHILVPVLALTLTLASECDKSGILIYEDLGCTPEEHSGTGCPKKYKCKGLEENKSECIFRGKTYAQRDPVDSSLTAPSCDIGCFCTENGKFTCAVLDCPEWLGVNPLKFKCYRNYTLDHCCSVGQVCAEDKTEKCTFDGKDYNEGEKFSPPNTCLRCVCQKGFEGKLEEPFCKRQLCGNQLRYSDKIQKSCAPFYSKQFHQDVLCCPDHWICPHEDETIEGEAKSDDVCKFGDKNVKVGQYLERVNITDNFGRNFTKIRCECVVPPLLMCRDV